MVLTSRDTDLSADSLAMTIEDCLEWYGLTVESNVICFTFDNTTVNWRQAELNEKPAVGCFAHCLQLAIKAFYKQMPGLTDALDSIHACIKSAMTIKNRAELRAIQEGAKRPTLAPVLHNKTRKWTGASAMVARFKRIQNDLRELDCWSNHRNLSSVERRPERKLGNKRRCRRPVRSAPSTKVKKLLLSYTIHEGMKACQKECLASRTTAM